MPKIPKRTHAAARARFSPRGAEPVTVVEARVQAEQFERIYVGLLSARFAGLATGYEVAIARVSVMTAWSRYVDRRKAAGLVRDGIPIVVERLELRPRWDEEE